MGGGLEEFGAWEQMPREMFCTHGQMRWNRKMEEAWVFPWADFSNQPHCITPLLWPHFLTPSAISVLPQTRLCPLCSLLPMPGPPTLPSTSLLWLESHSLSLVQSILLTLVGKEKGRGPRGGAGLFWTQGIRSLRLLSAHSAPKTRRVDFSLIFWS